MLLRRMPSLFCSLSGLCSHVSLCLSPKDPGVGKRASRRGAVGGGFKERGLETFPDQAQTVQVRGDGLER